MGKKGLSGFVPCSLGVLVDTDQSVLAAGGFLIQLLPGAPEDVISRIEAGISEVGTVTQMLDGGLDAWNMALLLCRAGYRTRWRNQFAVRMENR